jgi:hypothetical protein
MEYRPEYLNDFSYYRKLVSTMYKHSNYPLIFSLLCAFTGSLIYGNNPILGFALYGWLFLILYFIILNLSVLNS